MEPEGNDSVKPMISVVMPTYNSGKYVREAVESILDQTFGDFEFLIVNEYGSNDRTVEICEGYHDPRIKIIQNQTRLGLAQSLNKGFQMSRGKYIARMDSDDISLPSRFAKQVDYMESHPDVCVLGTWQEHFGAIHSVHTPPEEHEKIKIGMLFQCDLCHSTVFIRREGFCKHGLYYDPAYAAEDYELWLRAIRVVRFANIQEVLGRYRVTSGNRTNSIEKEIERQRQQLLGKLLGGFDIDYAGDYTFSTWEYFVDVYGYDQWKPRLLRLRKLLCDIFERNQLLHIYDGEALRISLQRYWLNQLDAPDKCLGEDRRLPLELIFDSIGEEAENKLPRGLDICLYGLGRIGKAALPHFVQYFGTRICCVSDSDSAKWGADYSGVRCVEPIEMPKGAAILVTAGYDAMAAIIPQLKGKGYGCVIPFANLFFDKENP